MKVEKLQKWVIGIALITGSNSFYLNGQNINPDQIRGKGQRDNRDYVFQATNGKTAVGNLSSPGNNVITLSPCPMGLAGANTGQTVYVSDGTGSAETGIVAGGSCISGANNGTIILTTTNAHSGSWTLTDSAGGTQAAICDLPTTGGNVWINNNIILYADVKDCGKQKVIVTRNAGITIAGSFKILGSSIPTHTQISQFSRLPSTSEQTGLYNGATFTIGDYPEIREFGLGTSAIQALVGKVGLPDDGTLVGQFVFGVAGYGMANRQGSDVGGVYGGAQCAKAFTQCWGANFTVAHANNNVGGSNYVGIEVDANNSAGGANAPAIISGITSYGNFIERASGYMHAYSAGSTNTHPWDISYNSAPGASAVAFQANTIAKTTNPSNSQFSIWAARTAAGVNRSAQIFFDADAVFWIRTSAGGGIAFDASNTSTPTMTISSAFIVAYKPVKLLINTFAQISGLGIGNGDMVYCSDCKITSGTNNTCTTGGTGAFLVQVNGVARCFDAQN